MSPTGHHRMTGLTGAVRRPYSALHSIRRMSRLLLSAAALVFISGCQLVDMAKFSYANAHSTHRWSGAQETTAIPFRLIDNHIILPVSINGSEPLNFVLDSGAGANVIMDSPATRALRLEMRGGFPVSGTGTGPDPMAHIVPGTDLLLGELTLEGQSMIHLPLDAVPFFDSPDDVYFDGVIGAPFFSRFVVEIDYDLGMVSFSEPSLAEPRIAALDTRWQALPLQIESGVPYATAQFDAGQGHAIAVKLLVDTGFRGSLSLTPATHGDLEEPRSYFQTVSEGLSGDVVIHVALSKSLTLANHRLDLLPVGYAIAGGESADDSNGLLGNELLQQFNLVFDYGNKRMFLSPNRNFGTAITADRSGLQLRPHAAGGIVRRIAVGSAGEASSLQIGDIITSFDDTPVDHASISALKRALASDRDSVRLCWRSNHGQHCEDLALAARLPQK